MKTQNLKEREKFSCTDQDIQVPYKTATARIYTRCTPIYIQITDISNLSLKLDTVLM